MDVDLLGLLGLTKPSGRSATTVGRKAAFSFLIAALVAKKEASCC